MAAPKPKFLLDENLNRLAKWLRILGYDAAVYKSISRQKQINLALKERRIILTRCKKSAASKQNFRRILIKNNEHFEQLQEIQNLLQFDKNKIFSRCLQCNHLLHEIEKDKIENLIPKFVCENFNEFKVCRKCGKIYWKGTHYKDMLQKLIDFFQNNS